MDHHTKDKPKNKVDMLLESVTGVPSELDDFVDFSMIAQAEALKFGIEHFRRRRPHCSGTLIWQLNDCWPGLSWALVDYHGFEKAAYHAVRRAYAPVLASFRLPGDGSVELWVTNDTPEPVADTARVRLGRFAGAPVHEQDVEVSVGPHASRRVARWDPGVLAAAPDRYLAVSSPAGAFPRNRAFFAAVKDLDRAPAHVEHEVVAAGDGALDVRLRSDRYAYFVHVAVADERVRASDNFVELEPGEERTITLTGPAGAVGPDDVAVRWR